VLLLYSAVLLSPLLIIVLLFTHSPTSVQHHLIPSNIQLDHPSPSGRIEDIKDSDESDQEGTVSSQMNGDSEESGEGEWETASERNEDISDGDSELSRVG
jgi:hypothetical protein